MKPKIIVIVGPTAVGKSEVALDLAGKLGAEIINADSQQVYRYMDIGTGKPAKKQRLSIPHHLIDVVDPDQEFNAALFRSLAMEAVEKIHLHGKRAIVCGGTGLYIKALTQGLFVGPPQDKALRQRLTEELEEGDVRNLYQRLVRADPSAVSRIHPNDRQRIIRALEVHELTGRPISEWQDEHAFKESPFETLKIGLDRDRAELYDMINRRCDRMIEDGLVAEAQRLVAKGYRLQLKALQSVGYRHAGLFLTGAMTLNEAVLLMKRDTRRLAKRQLTWFRGDKEVHWFHPNRDQERLTSLASAFVT